MTVLKRFQDDRGMVCVLPEAAKSGASRSNGWSDEMISQGKGTRTHIHATRAQEDEQHQRWLCMSLAGVERLLLTSLRVAVGGVAHKLAYVDCACASCRVYEQQ